MDGKLIIEMIGYLGSALVVVSMLMTSVVKLRVVNTIGSLIFMCYALIIGSYPTAVMNFCLIAINVYHLIRLFRDRKEYDLVDLTEDESFVRYFLEKNGEDIRSFFPWFKAEDLQGDVRCLACCGSQPASLFIAKTTGADALEVVLDYAAPLYRDTSAGRFLHEQLKQKGIRTVVFRGDAPKHVAYMEKIGYRKESDGSWVLTM